MGVQAIIKQAYAAIGQADYVLQHQERLAHRIIREALFVLASTPLDYLREQAALISKEGIPVEPFQNLHSKWVEATGPINPKTGQPHTPETARADWVSGMIPFLDTFFPDASQHNIFAELPSHEKAVREVLQDLQRDDGSLDRMTAAAIAVHARQNGRPYLFNRIDGMENSRLMEQGRTWRQDLQKQREKGMGVLPDGTIGKLPQQPQPLPHRQYPTGLELRRRMMMPRAEAEALRAQEDSLLQPQTPQGQTPQGEIHRRIQEMGKGVGQGIGTQPYETTPQPVR